ncbi:uncharacterized protein LACBIDRAFT_330912 [Laccaria bicolor S238N-H82]|uniref:Predicted protein n=1 Tax=Laccaria bicolor (strain S238N-H82 / ATCC MYA-4686) TaxID=486041 RepID=B0DN57_LACBS|nr:uncharacterized protein LACBIDRAFT_330912 [Laccaria bicolor S238N-H82]EDR03997.1 predicted protein [Laccaria bicolor S238N-H82]|eukprot:XP_001885252.1 predicted protein [Laccaria bicolor S238N-H82]
MSSLHVVATVIVQFFLVAWGWICNSIRNLAQSFKPFAMLPQFAHVSLREPAHTQDRILEGAHQSAVSDIACGSSKGPILPVYTTTQGQNTQLRGLQQPTNAIWNPYLPADVTTTPAVHSPSLTSKDLDVFQPSVISYPEPTYSPNLPRATMRNLEAITSPKHLKKLDSVIFPSPQNLTSTKVVATVSTPVELPPTSGSATLAVVAPLKQEGHPSLYDCENALRQVDKSFIEADALCISETQVSSSLDFVENSRPSHSDQTAGSIKKKRRAVVAMPMPAFETSTDSPYRNDTTFKEPTASSALTAADSQDDSLLDVDAIIALAGTLCNPTSSSSSGSSDIAQSLTLQVDPTTPSQTSGNMVIEAPTPQIRHCYLPIQNDLEPSNSPEFTLPSPPQSPNSVDFDHLRQYHEEESTLAYLQHSGQNSPRSTRICGSLEAIREEDEEPSFYDDILATPSPPSHHESTFPDNPQVTRQDSAYEPPTTKPERKKRRFSLVDIQPRSKVIPTQKKKRRSAPSVLGLGWLNKTTSSPQERERSPGIEPVPPASPLRPLLLPMQLAMRGNSTPLKRDHSSTVSTHAPKRRSWFKNLTSQHSSSWQVSPPILNLIPATPPLNDNPNKAIEDPTISNGAPLSIDPKFLYPADPSSVFEPDEIIDTTDPPSPTITEPTPIESDSDDVAENRRSKSLAELIALIDSYDFENGRMKGDSSEPQLGDLSSSEAQLDWAATSSSSSSSDDESYFDESEDSMSIGLAL